MKNTDPGLLSNLPTYADEGSVHAVVGQTPVGIDVIDAVVAKGSLEPRLTRHGYNVETLRAFR